MIKAQEGSGRLHRLPLFLREGVPTAVLRASKAHWLLPLLDAQSMRLASSKYIEVRL